jgi:uncharacterized protein
MRNNWCRLKPSLIEGAGVGVFAVEEIPSGIDPFPNCDTILTRMSNHEFQSLSDAKKKMVRDFCYGSGGYWMIPHDFNKLDISWYVNSSNNPNLFFDVTTGKYKTLRKIEIGEELTYDYIVYE